MKNMHGSLILLLAALTLAPEVWASPTLPPAPTTQMQTIALNTVFTGSTPDGTAPWLTATFSWVPGNMNGTLLLSAKLSSGVYVSDFVANTPNNGWVFYLSSLPSSTSSCASGNCPSISIGSQSFGPVRGGFNLGFGWNPPPSSRFDGTDSAVIDLNFGSALGTSSPFIANADGWLSAAHVQGIGPKGKCSGYIVSGTGTPQRGSPCSGTTPPPTNVPEPGVLGMFGLGLGLTGLFVGFRKRRRRC